MAMGAKNWPGWYPSALQSVSSWEITFRWMRYTGKPKHEGVAVDDVYYQFHPISGQLGDGRFLNLLQYYRGYFDPQLTHKTYGKSWKWCAEYLFLWVHWSNFFRIRQYTCGKPNEERQLEPVYRCISPLWATASRLPNYELSQHFTNGRLWLPKLGVYSHLQRFIPE